MFGWFKKKAPPPPNGPDRSAADYHVALFAPDGSLTRVAPCSVSVLSPRWMDFWRQVLGTYGRVFKTAIPIPPLSHIEVRFTGGDGWALVGFTVQGQPVTSAVALTGRNPAGEAEVLQAFVDSLRRTRAVRTFITDEPPFQAVFSVTQRPLYVAVIWANPSVNDEDHETVIEFESHLAGVYFGDFCDEAAPAAPDHQD